MYFNRLEVLWVYSTKLDNKRYSVRCIRAARDVKTIEFMVINSKKVDTKYELLKQ